MNKCHVDTGFRLWPPVSFSDLRRGLLNTISCGTNCSRRPKRRKTKLPPPKTPAPLSELLDHYISDSDQDSESEPESESEYDDVTEGLREMRKEAAAEARRMAKDNADARESLAARGAVPLLVGMIDCADVDARVEVLYALLNLGIGNHSNKAAMVKEGIIHKMLDLTTTSLDPAITSAIIANLLSLSALDANKPIIGASAGIIPFLITSFLTSSSNQSKHDSLRAIFNLSLSPDNSAPLLHSQILPVLVDVVAERDEFSERALAMLCNLVSESDTRTWIVESRHTVSVLVGALGWFGEGSSQEHAAYVVMVLAYKGNASCHAALHNAGITSVLLELALMGTALAQKRASRILEILKVNKGKQVSEGFEHTSVHAASAEMPLDNYSAVTELVKESLRGNMRRIIRRANIPMDTFTASEINAVAGTSKSLPF